MEYTRNLLAAVRAWFRRPPRPDTGEPVVLSQRTRKVYRERSSRQTRGCRRQDVTLTCARAARSASWRERFRQSTVAAVSFG